MQMLDSGNELTANEHEWTRMKTKNSPQRHREHGEKRDREWTGMDAKMSPKTKSEPRLVFRLSDLSIRIHSCPFRGLPVTLACIRG